MLDTCLLSKNIYLIIIGSLIVNKIKKYFSSYNVPIYLQKYQCIKPFYMACIGFGLIVNLSFCQHFSLHENELSLWSTFGSQAHVLIKYGYCVIVWPRSGHRQKLTSIVAVTTPGHTYNWKWSLACITLFVANGPMGLAPVQFFSSFSLHIVLDLI